MKLSVIMSIILLAMSTSFTQITPESITYLTENYPPANYKAENGTVKGYATEILREVWKQMKVKEQPIKVMKWDRAYKTVLENDNQMLYAMVRSKEREEKFKWVGPVATSRQVLVALDSDNRKEIADEESVKQYKIGVIKGDIGEEILDNMSFPAKNKVTAPQLDGLRQLLLTRAIDFILVSNNILFDLQGLIGEDNNIYEAFTMEKNQLYFAFSKNVPDELIEKFQKALDAVELKQKEILEEYGIGIFDE